MFSKCFLEFFWFIPIYFFGLPASTNIIYRILGLMYILWLFAYYRLFLQTSELGLTESIGESGCRFEIWFRKRTPGMTYVMQPQSSDVKQQWVDEISQLLWKQTFRNRERRMAEMACMGIGSKPSLDLKQSKDNINDRFVNICPSDRNRGIILDGRVVALIVFTSNSLECFSHML